MDGPGFPVGYFVGTRCAANSTVRHAPCAPAEPGAAPPAPIPADSTRRPKCGEECILFERGVFPLASQQPQPEPPPRRCASGELLRLLLATEARLAASGNASALAEAREGIGGGPLSGRFNLSTGKWEFPGDCQLLYFPPAESFAQLRGRRVVLAGDSMLRNLFLRFVWLLRGIPIGIDRVFHGDAVYLRNATHDYLWLQRLYGDAFDPAAVLFPDVSVTYLWQGGSTGTEVPEKRILAGGALDLLVRIA